MTPKSCPRRPLPIVGFLMFGPSVRRRACPVARHPPRFASHAGAARPEARRRLRRRPRRRRPHRPRDRPPLVAQCSDQTWGWPGGFGAGTQLVPTMLAPNYVKAADLSGDGRLDLIVYTWDDSGPIDKIAIHVKQAGAGTRAPHTWHCPGHGLARRCRGGRRRRGRHPRSRRDRSRPLQAGDRHVPQQWRSQLFHGVFTNIASTDVPLSVDLADTNLDGRLDAYAVGGSTQALSAWESSAASAASPRPPGLRWGRARAWSPSAISTATATPTWSSAAARPAGIAHTRRRFVASRRCHGLRAAGHSLDRLRRGVHRFPRAAHRRPERRRRHRHCLHVTARTRSARSSGGPRSRDTWRGPSAAAGTGLELADFDADGDVDLLLSSDGGVNANFLANMAAPVSGFLAFGSGTPGCWGTLGLAAGGAPSVGNAQFKVLATGAPPTPSASYCWEMAPTSRGAIRSASAACSMWTSSPPPCCWASTRSTTTAGARRPRSRFPTFRRCWGPVRRADDWGRERRERVAL